MSKFLRHFFGERAALRRELEAIWVTRQHCNQRETEITARLGVLALREVNDAVAGACTEGLVMQNRRHVPLFLRAPEPAPTPPAKPTTRQVLAAVLAYEYALMVTAGESRQEDRVSIAMRAALTAAFREAP